MKEIKSVEKEIPVVMKEKHVPSEFFKDREGLFVYSGFEENIRDKAEPTEAGKEFKIASFDLAEDANDAEIEEALPKDYLFLETDVCAIIAGLIEKQAKGEEGTLLNNGYVNLFYTPSRVVYVRWRAGEWLVGAWYRGVSSWYAGYRVFSPATGA